MNKQIPEVLSAMTVYSNGTDELGVVDVGLPELSAMTQTVSGAGILGEYETAVIGSFGSITVTLNWRVMDRMGFKMARPEVHSLDFRGSIQIFDTVAGEYKHTGVKVTVRSTAKNMNLGNFAQAATMDSSNELEILYIKIEYDGAVVFELDKINYIFVVEGKDYMETIRKNLGK